MTMYAAVRILDNMLSGAVYGTSGFHELQQGEMEVSFPNMVFTHPPQAYKYQGGVPVLQTDLQEIPWSLEVTLTDKNDVVLTDTDGDGYVDLDTDDEYVKVVIKLMDSTGAYRTGSQDNYTLFLNPSAGVIKIDDETDADIASVALVNGQVTVRWSLPNKKVTGSLVISSSEENVEASTIRCGFIQASIEREVIIRPTGPDIIYLGSGIVLPVSANGSGNFSYGVPFDFKSLVSAKLIYLASAGAVGTGKDIDFISQYGAPNEAAGLHGVAYTMSTTDVTNSSDLNEMDISRNFTDLGAGDEGGLQITHNAIGGTIYYGSLRFRYRT